MFFDQLLEDARVSFSSFGEALTFESDTYRGLRGALIWYNPGAFETLALTNGADSEWLFSARQRDVLLRYLEYWIEANAQCIDPPSLQRQWSNKLVLLSKLSREFPQLLPSTHVKQRIEPSDIGSVVKTVSETRSVGPGTAFYATVLNASTVASLATDREFPVMLVQSLVSNDSEYRAYLFGRHSVSIRLVTETGPTGIVDSSYFPKNYAMASVERGGHNADLWSRLQKVLGLKVFAVDYRYVGVDLKILDVNPVFSWSWLPADCVVVVEEACLRFLADERSGG